MTAIKLIVTSKNNLQFKYGKNFSKIEALLNKLKVADKKKDLIQKSYLLMTQNRQKQQALKK
jgi:hypothetical protein